MKTTHSAEDGAPIVTVDDLLAKMRAGVRESHEITLRELTIPVRVLSVDELNNIRRDSIKHATMQAGDDTDRNLHIQKTTLKMASTVAKGGAPVLGDKLLSMLSMDEINYLYDEFMNVMDRVNPALDQLTQEEFRAIVDALKKNTITSRDLSLHQLRAVCTAYQDLIRRQDSQMQPPDSSSGG